MKKNLLLLVLFILAVISAGCGETETSPNDEEIEQAKEDIERVVDTAIKAQETLSQTQIDNLKLATKTIYIARTQINVNQNSVEEIAVGVKNNQAAQDTFSLSAQCQDAPDLISSDTLVVGPEEVGISILEINTEGFESGTYFCSVSAVSTANDYAEDVFVVIG